MYFLYVYLFSLLSFPLFCFSLFSFQSSFVWLFLLFFFFFFFLPCCTLAVSWLPGQELVTVSRAEVMVQGSDLQRHRSPTPPNPGNILSMVSRWNHLDLVTPKCLWAPVLEAYATTNQEYRNTVTLPQPSAGCLKSYQAHTPIPNPHHLTQPCSSEGQDPASLRVHVPVPPRRK